MPTELMFIRGKASWAFTNAPDPWGSYTITLHPNSDGLEKIRELQGQGLKNVLKKDEDGWFIKFRRPQSKEIRGRVVPFTPPEVIMEENKQPLQGLIGNGSDVTVKLEVYPHATPGGGKAKAARFLGVMVHNLVPYVSKEEQYKQITDEDALF